jgi:hypothetical protein
LNLLSIYLALCGDEIPLARKYASMNLKVTKDFVVLINKNLARSLNSNNEGDLVNCVKSLMKDDQDFVKLYIAEALVVLAQQMSTQVYPMKIVLIY